MKGFPCVTVTYPAPESNCFHGKQLLRFLFVGYVLFVRQCTRKVSVGCPVRLAEALGVPWERFAEGAEDIGEEERPAPEKPRPRRKGEARVRKDK